MPLFYLCFLSLIAPSAAANAPAVHSVWGKPSNGSRITVMGVGFGNHALHIEWLGGPNGAIEQMEVGAEVRKTKPLDARWTEPGWLANPGIQEGSGIWPNISDEFAFAGQRAIKMYGWDGEPPGIFYTPADDPEIALENFQEIWFSSWLYFHPIANDGTGRSQWKIHTVQSNDTGSVAPGSVNYSANWTPDGSIMNSTLQIYPVRTDWFGCNQYPCVAPVRCMTCAYQYGVRGKVEANDYIYFRRDSRGDVTPPPLESERWMRLEMRVRASSAFDIWDGVYEMRLLRPGEDPWVYRLDGICTHSASPETDVLKRWERAWRSVWWKNQLSHRGGEAVVWSDDHYIQFGSAARIELGDRPQYESCTELAIQRPTSWSDDSISLELNAGRFEPGASLHLFVIDASERVSRGFPLQIE